MKYILLITLLTLVSCSHQSVTPNLGDTANSTLSIAPNPTPIPSTPTTSKPEIEYDLGLCENYEQIEISKTDSPIGKIDFKNFTHPKIWKEGSIKLKNGCLGEIYEVGGVCEFTLSDVEFIDFNKDGLDEALVQIENLCGNGSSSVSSNFLLYGIVNSKPELLWKLSTGSESNCGIKEYEFEDNEIRLEVFSNCSIETTGDLKDNAPSHGDPEADNFTTFVFGWNGNQFAVKNREVFPFPTKNIQKYLNSKSKGGN